MSYQALLFCPDEKTARVVTQVLTELEFSVELSNEPFATVKKLMAKQYDAIVVDCDNEQNAALLFKSARNSQSNQASLAVAVVEGQAGVAKAFRIGANLVLTKPVNVEQSKGTLRVARGLLKKAESGKTAPSAPLMAVPGSTSRPPSSTVIPRPAVQGSGLPVTMPFAPTGFSPKTAGLSGAVSSATFEIEEDPTPDPEPTEAAFLQSIPATHSVTPKESSPWAQMSKPSGSAAETNNSTAESHTQASAAVLPPPAPVRHPFNTGRSFGQAAAAAPAREPEVLAAIPELKAAATTKSKRVTGETQTQESSIGGLPEAEAIRQAIGATAKAESKSSKLPLIAAIAVVVIAGAGYYGWTRLNSATATAAPVQTNAPSSQQSQAIAPQPSSAVPVPAEASQPETDVQSAKKSSQPLPKLTQSQPADTHPTKPSPAGKPAADEIVVIENPGSNASTEDKPALAKKKVAETLTVKPDAAASEQQVAPPALQAQADTSDQAIAGIITSTNMPLPKRAPEVLRVSQGITEGMLVKKVAPVYPARALQMHIQGVVEVLATITKNGSISAAKVTKGDATLGGAAVAAVKQWKYKPYTLNGQPVEVQTQVMVNFKLP